MGKAISSLNIVVSAFTAPATTGLTKLAGVVANVTNDIRTYGKLVESTRELKLASSDTLTGFRTTLAVARSELRKFAANKDVQVALEIGREKIDETLRSAHAYAQRLAKSVGIDVGAKVVTKGAADARAWLARQRVAALKPITARIELARSKIDAQAASIFAKLNRYRTFRITLAAINATRAPAQAALSTLGPLTRLARAGVVVALRATHHGIASGVQRAKASLMSLASAGRSVVSSLTSGFGLVSLALGALGGYSLTSLIKSSNDAIDANAKLSDRLGITTEALAGLQHAGKLAGTSSEDLTGALEKMLRNTAEAAQGAGPAADAFKRLGISADEVASMQSDQAFGLIADKLNSVQNVAERASLSMDIFGRSGQALGPLLDIGSKGIADARAEAEKLGLTFSRVDAAKVEAANDAWTKVGEAVTGVSNIVSVQLAPYLEVAANKLLDVATAGEGIGPKVLNAFEWVTTAIAKAADYLKLFEVGWYGLKSVTLGSVALMMKAIDAVGGTVADLVNMLPGVQVSWSKSWGIMTESVSQDAAQAMGEATKALQGFKLGENQQAVTAWFADVRKKADDSAKAIAFNNAVQNIYLPALQQALGGVLNVKPLRKIRITPEIDESKIELGHAKAAADAAEQIKRDLERQAEDVIESVKTPAEKLADQMKELQTLRDAKLIDEGIFARASAKAQEDFSRVEDKLDDVKSKAMEVRGAIEGITAGSAESQILQARAALDARRVVPVVASRPAAQAHAVAQDNRPRSAQAIAEPAGQSSGGTWDERVPKLLRELINAVKSSGVVLNEV
ncbi:MAG: hypothetical protein QM770_07945 [Tepidisphaeraceae bacterium]